MWRRALVAPPQCSAAAGVACGIVLLHAVRRPVQPRMNGHSRLTFLPLELRSFGSVEASAQARRAQGRRRRRPDSHDDKNVKQYSEVRSLPPWRSERTLSPVASPDEPPRVWPLTEAAKHRERRRLRSTTFVSRISDGPEQGQGSAPSQALSVPFLPKDCHLASFLADRTRQDADLLEHLVHTNAQQATSSFTPVVDQLPQRRAQRRCG